MAKTEDKSAIPITVQFRPQQVDFLEKAAKSASKARTVFLREAMLEAASRQLGADPPEAEPFDLGAQSIVSRAAKQAGVPVRQYVREMATLAIQQGLAVPRGGKMMTTRERIEKRAARLQEFLERRALVGRVGKKASKKK
jgi:hypothetical protein